MPVAADTSPQSAPSCHPPKPTHETDRPRRGMWRCSMAVSLEAGALLPDNGPPHDERVLQVGWQLAVARVGEHPEGVERLREETADRGRVDDVGDVGVGQP